MAVKTKAAARPAAKPAATPAPRESISSLRGRLRRTEMLIRLSQRVAVIDSLDDLLATLVEIIANETNAERGTLFLNDPVSNELYSRAAQGTFSREIRLLNNSGIAGHVFQTGEGLIIHDPYKDQRFNDDIDRKTGFKTKSILCAPIKTARGEIIGVVQTLNKREGRFNSEDLDLLEAMATQASVALQSSQFIEGMKKTRQQEMEFLDLVADITSSLDLSVLLRRVMSEATRMLKADRSTLFLNNEKTSELWSEVGEGLNAVQIKLPNTAGIAGAVFQSGKTINIPHAYADLRFNPAFDKRTGYFTRSILCVPVVNKNGKCIGVTQALNKRGGPFTAEDEARLKAFTAQVSIALENAKLFDDVQNMRNYNQSVLESMSSGVITLGEEGRIHTCNASGYRIVRAEEAAVLGKVAADFFTGPNQWVADRLKAVAESGKSAALMDAEVEFGGAKVNVNVTFSPSSASRASGSARCSCSRTSPPRSACSPPWRATWTPASRTSCSRRAARRWAGRVSRPPCCSPTSARSPRSPRSSARRARWRCSTSISRSWSSASPTRAACSTSSSATRSWPSSASRWPTATTPTGGCARPSR